MGQPLSFVTVGQSLIKRDMRALGSSPAVRDILKSADVVFTNLEATITGQYGGWPTKPDYYAGPYPFVLDVLKDLGFNALSLSNNHAFDLGPNGVLSTLDEVKRRGFLHAGIGTDLTSASQPGFLDMPVGRIALVAVDGGPNAAYTYAKDGTEKVPPRPGVNRQHVESVFLVGEDELAMLRRLKASIGHEAGHAPFYTLRPSRLPEGDLDFYGLRFRVGAGPRIEGIPDAADLERNLAAIRKARSSADFVIAYLHHHHWEPRLSESPAWARTFAQSCIDAGANVFVSHGVPMLQGIEIHAGRPIFHSLGNFIFHSYNPKSWFNDWIWQSVIARCQFAGDGSVGAIDLHPIVVGGEAALAGGDFTSREAPEIAEGARADAILGRLDEVSRPLGSRVVIADGRGRLVVDAVKPRAVAE